MKLRPLLLAASLWLPLAATVAAQAPPPPATGPVVYPAKNQTPEQQAKDQAECKAWATQQTGFDPAAPVTQAKAQPAPVTGSGARVAGAARGAVVAEATGGHASDGAVAGAVVGGVVRRNKNRAAAAQQNQAAEQQRQAAMAQHGKAQAACLEGRGYTVK